MKFLGCSLLVLAVACLIGCDSSSTVSGKITMNGAPIDNGEVMFHPDAQGAIAIGSVANGSYELSTGQSDLVAAGNYKVTVVANEKVDPAEFAAKSQGGMEYVPKRLTPDAYADVKTTPLTAEVKPGANTFNFDLK